MTVTAAIDQPSPPREVARRRVRAAELGTPLSRRPPPLAGDPAQRPAPATLGTECSQSRSARPPSTNRSPPGGEVVLGAAVRRDPLVAAVPTPQQPRRRTPSVRITTSVSSVKRMSRSRWNAWQSSPSRYQMSEKPSKVTPYFAWIARASRAARDAGPVARRGIRARRAVPRSNARSARAGAAPTAPRARACRTPRARR